MITPNLEKLILKGKATARTFMAGGAEKCVLQIPDDKHAVIHNLVHFPFTPNEEEIIGELLQKQTTQLQVFSNGAYANFVFRNSINLSLNLDDTGTLTNTRQFGNPINIDTWLLHEDDISFSFSYATDLTSTLDAVAPSKSVAKRPFTDYGKEGISTAVGNLPVSRKRNYLFPSTSLGEFRPLGNVDQPTPGKTTSTEQLQFPVDDGTRIIPSDMESRNNYPLLLVQYVLIDGTPADIRQQL